MRSVRLRRHFACSAASAAVALFGKDIVLAVDDQHRVIALQRIGVFCGSPRRGKAPSTILPLMSKSHPAFQSGGVDDGKRG